MPVPDNLSELSRRIAASDTSAFRALFDATHDALLRYAGALVRDDATARDLVQDAFIRFWNRRDQLDAERAPRALLFRTVRNLAFNHSRDERTRLRLLSTEYEPAIWRDPGPDAHLAVHDMEGRLHRWIGALPARQREALTLSRFEGLSHAEIASVMGVSSRTINNHLVRALEFLRDRLDEHTAAEEDA